MTNLIPSSHLVARQQQRGIRRKDVALVHSLAKEITPARFWLSNHDADREIVTREKRIRELERVGDDEARRDIRRLRAEIVRIDSLRGWLVVVEGETGVTVFHHRRRPRRDMRRRTSLSRRRSR